MRILVTGATGFIGSQFCRAATDAGHEIVALVRPGRRYSGSGIVVYGSLPYDVPQRAWMEVDACVHCAAVTTSSAASQSEAVNLEGTRFLLSGASRDGISRFVFLSSQSAHEDAVSAYGITKREGEQLVRDAGVPYAILRPGLVYGPGEQGLFWRMRKSVKKMPVLPLLGGGNALVQAIHVDELCTAILRCLELPSNKNEELNLGDPEGVPLREFLQELSLAERGRRKLEIPIPLKPVEVVIAAGERLGLPLPISSDNLKGMQVVRRMETASSLDRINLILSGLRDGLTKSVGPDVATIEDFSGERMSSAPIRVMLIGAGKIGIVHALNARQREDEELVGIVDPNPKAFRLYRSMGFRSAFYTDLASAVREQQPRAVIIATPASTHLEIARWCIERDLPVLVEKPLAIRHEDLQEFRRLSESRPDLPCAAGYMAAQFPHFGRASQVIRSGVLGKVVSFRILALQSHIMAAKPIRWEMIPEKSGGGALINFAGHVVSMMFRLFGTPVQYDAVRWAIHSSEVEDAVAAKIRYPDFSGELLASWSAPGYARPLNSIEIKCERGTVAVQNFCTSIRSGGRTQQVWSQRAFDVGYNASPDYTGAGFSAEHRNFIRAVHGRETDSQEDPSQKLVSFQEAVGIESWIYQLYAATPIQSPTREQLGHLLADRELHEIAQTLRKPGGTR